MVLCHSQQLPPPPDRGAAWTVNFLSSSFFQKPNANQTSRARALLPPQQHCRAPLQLIGTEQHVKNQALRSLLYQTPISSLPLLLVPPTPHVDQPMGDCAHALHCQHFSPHRCDSLLDGHGKIPQSSYHPSLSSNDRAVTWHLACNYHIPMLSSRPPKTAL